MENNIMTQEEMQTIIKRANENSTRQYELGYEKAKEQLIEKACKWLNDWFTDDIGRCGLPITKTARDDFFNDFKKVMMEE